MVRQSVAPPYGRWIFFAVLGLATIGVTLRLNLLFTSRVHTAMLRQHRARLRRPLVVSESGLAVLLLTSALLLGGASDAAAAALLSLAVVIAASLAVIEPATTSAAGLEGP